MLMMQIKFSNGAKHCVDAMLESGGWQLRGAGRMTLARNSRGPKEPRVVAEGRETYPDLEYAHKVSMVAINPASRD